MVEDLCKSFTLRNQIPAIDAENLEKQVKKNIGALLRWMWFWQLRVSSRLVAC